MEILFICIIVGSLLLFVIAFGIAMALKTLMWIASATTYVFTLGRVNLFHEQKVAIAQENIRKHIAEQRIAQEAMARMGNNADESTKQILESIKEEATRQFRSRTGHA